MTDLDPKDVWVEYCGNGYYLDHEKYYFTEDLNPVLDVEESHDYPTQEEAEAALEELRRRAAPEAETEPPSIEVHYSDRHWYLRDSLEPTGLKMFFTRELQPCGAMHSWDYDSKQQAEEARDEVLRRRGTAGFELTAPATSASGSAGGTATDSGDTPAAGGTPEEQISVWQQAVGRSDRVVKPTDPAKVPWQLLPLRATEQVIRVLQHGSTSEPGRRPWNWLSGGGAAYSAYYGAVQRHLTAWFRGEDLDPQSNLNHLAHAACGILILLTWQLTGVAEDDRPEKDPSA